MLPDTGISLETSGTVRDKSLSTGVKTDVYSGTTTVFKKINSIVCLITAPKTKFVEKSHIQILQND